MQSHWSPVALAAVGLGGAAGSIARYVLGSVLQRAGAGFPHGTLGVNVSGSFLLGAILPFLVARGSAPELRLLLTIGLCGGYTTFSTFAYESALMIQDGRFARAGVYVTASVVLTIAAMFAGFAVSRAVTLLGR
jgi:CrcB protein